MMKTNAKVVKYMKDVRKPKNTEALVKSVREVLSHMNI